MAVERRLHSHVAVGNISHSHVAVGRGCGGCGATATTAMWLWVAVDSRRLWRGLRDLENLCQGSGSTAMWLWPQPYGCGGCDGCGLTATTAMLPQPCGCGQYLPQPPTAIHSHPQPCHSHPQPHGCGGCHEDSGFCRDFARGKEAMTTIRGPLCEETML